jgi:hypothetical protein
MGEFVKQIYREEHANGQAVVIRAGALWAAHMT